MHEAKPETDAQGVDGESLDATEIQHQRLAEYNALRSEIIHRMGVRQRTVAFSVVVLGAVLTFHAPPETVLVYPILGFFLALGWAHNDFRIGKIGKYIETEIERWLPGLGWETHFADITKREMPLRYILRATVFSAGGIIVGTQVLALVIPFVRRTAQAPSTWWLPVDVVFILMSVAVLNWRKTVYWGQEKADLGSAPPMTSGAPLDPCAGATPDKQP